MIKTGIVSRKAFGGTVKHYATGLVYSNISEKELVNYMLQNSQVGKTAAENAVEAFKAALTTFLLNGHTVSIPNLGTFSLIANTDSKKVTLTPPADASTPEGKEQLRKFRQQVADAITNIRVRFTPTSDVRLAAKSAKFQGILVQDDSVDNG